MSSQNTDGLNCSTPNKIDKLQPKQSKQMLTLGLQAVWVKKRRAVWTGILMERGWPVCPVEEAVLPGRSREGVCGKEGRVCWPLREAWKHVVDA